eukprot:767131-Hanusia_phi.AAC.5
MPLELVGAEDLPPCHGTDPRRWGRELEESGKDRLTLILYYGSLLNQERYETQRQIESFRTFPIVPGLPAPDLLLLANNS